jgi:hypothetical protein
LNENSYLQKKKKKKKKAPWETHARGKPESWTCKNKGREVVREIGPNELREGEINLWALARNVNLAQTFVVCIFILG